MQRIRPTQSGFTLLEVIAATAILTVLLSIAAFSIIGKGRDARIAAAVLDAENIAEVATIAGKRVIASGDADGDGIYEYTYFELPEWSTVAELNLEMGSNLPLATDFGAAYEVATDANGGRVRMVVPEPGARVRGHRQLASDADSTTLLVVAADGPVKGRPWLRTRAHSMKVHLYGEEVR